jgi:hypothetical protein
MNDDRELISALAGRERARGRMRLATAGLGAAALVTAGVVAYHLPAPAHKTASTTTVTPSAQPTVQVPTSYGGDDGGSSTSSGLSTSGGTTHSTSGGS